MTEREIVLEARGIARAFPGVQALAGVDLTLRAGEVHALMGQNGAGKSTLIKVLTGLCAPDAGSIKLFDRSNQGAEVALRTPQQAQRLGISAHVVRPSLRLSPVAIRQRFEALQSQHWRDSFEYPRSKRPRRYARARASSRSTAFADKPSTRAASAPEMPSS